jgi:hypothetical protein
VIAVVAARSNRARSACKIGLSCKTTCDKGSMVALREMISNPYCTLLQHFAQPGQQANLPACRVFRHQAPTPKTLRSTAGTIHNLNAAFQRLL